MVKTGIAALLLAALLFTGFRSVGPVPPLGRLLDPANGVWATARAADLPAMEQERIPGLTKPVEVVFDDRGVPHIFAATEDDAYRALGYVMARDRLFQMELQTFAAAGRLTEWVGPKAIEADRRTRAIGLPWGAERKFASYDKSSESFRAMSAYSDGVNAWISSMKRQDLPIEFRLLGITPFKWEPIHSLYFFAKMALTLGFNDATYSRLAAQAKVGRAAADALFPVNSPIQEPIQPNGSNAPRYDLAAIPAPGAPDSGSMLALEARRSIVAALGGEKPNANGDALGSNNWAVSPKRTKNGYALLAGDPHLDLTLPSIWYEMHLVVPGKLDVAGVGFPGVPGVIIGFNRNVAWTFTNTGSDVSDYYVETVDDASKPTRYRLDGAWRPIETRVESYRDQKGGVLRADTLYFTHRGPMTMQGGKWVSLRWTAFEPSAENGNFLKAQYSKSVTEWLDAMKTFLSPAQNGLVADRGGNIAIRSMGHYPIRPGDGRGDLLRDGSTSASDWQGYVPIQQYPFSLNPPQGFLASANQQPVDPHVNPNYFGSDWYSPWRAMRINQLLREDSAVTPDAMRRFQTDPGSARADAFVPRFLSAAAHADSIGKSDDTLREAAKLLAEWDRKYTKTNRRAVLFENAMQQLVRRTWDELATDKEKTGVRLPQSPPESQILYELMETPTSPWWDDRHTRDVVEDRDAILTASLRAALLAARNDHGDPSSDGWLWSKAQHANIYHLARIPAFSALDIPVQGGPSTLSPSGSSGTQGPSWRMVVELGPEVKAWATYPGGQSGNPSSPRYTDRLPLWERGELAPILFPKSARDIDKNRVISKLTLMPQ
ncbi:MAG TPA: penicillin acylase family protein [Gemmatimonadaceae bacterium]|nr:penicillin acylase family protein [Gemmatimonadaceae bacterium]